MIFVQKARRLLAYLSSKITDYFFDSQPGVVEVSDFRYRHYSISVVTAALIQISQEVKKRLPRTS